MTVTTITPAIERRPPPAFSARPLRLAIHTVDGRHVSSGWAEITERGGGIEVRASRLTRPGALLTMHVRQGVARFLLSFADGRSATAQLVRTNWEADGDRVCYFVLAPPASNQA
jgi:hypothetical protein